MMLRRLNALASSYKAIKFSPSMELRVPRANFLRAHPPYRPATLSRCCEHGQKCVPDMLRWRHSATAVNSSPTNLGSSLPSQDVALPRSTIKRRKEHTLDHVVDRNKKFILVQRLKELLEQSEDGRMSLRALGRYRQRLPIPSGRRLVALVKRFPLVFDVEDHGAGHICFRLSARAAALRRREQQLRTEMEPRLRDKVCKLLMMSSSRSLPVEGLAHIRRELGLPEDFKQGFLHAHPTHFSVQPSEKGPLVVLSAWREELEETALEAREREERRLEAEREQQQAEQRRRLRHLRLGAAESSGEGSAVEESVGRPDSENRCSAVESVEAPAAVAAAGAGWDSESLAGLSDGESSEWDDEALPPPLPSHPPSPQASPGLPSGDAAAAAAIQAGRALVGAGTYVAGGTAQAPGSGAPLGSRLLAARRVELNLPPGMKLRRSDLERLRVFHSAPLPSPFREEARQAAAVAPNSLEAERRAVAVVAELLALTVERRCLVDHVTHFRKDFMLPSRIRAMLIRHPEYFYVSEKGIRDSVFLRSAYDGDKLREGDELAEVLEEMRLLVLAGRRGAGRSAKNRGESRNYENSPEDEDGDEEDDWTSDEERWLDEEEDNTDDDANSEDLSQRTMRAPDGSVSAIRQIGDDKGVPAGGAPPARPKERW